MDSSSTDKILTDRKRLIEELTQGRELVKKLKIFLAKPTGNDKYWVANDLLVKISSSLTDSISMMNQSPKDNVLATALGVPEIYDPKEESHGSSKTLDVKDRRGCYKRRKKSHTSIQIIPNLIDDGHGWRKYGQKRIQNFEQPRNYFRCTHKFDQGCQATKQVQKTEDEPPMYQITYHGKHTCKNLFLKTPQLIFDNTGFNASKFLISFDSTNNFHGSPTFPNFHIIKEEYNPITDYKNSSSSDRQMSPDVTGIGSSEPMSVFSSGSDCGDIMSYFTATSAPSYGFEQMDVMHGHGFSDNLEFEFQQYFSCDSVYPISTIVSDV